MRRLLYLITRAEPGGVWVQLLRNLVHPMKLG